MLCNAALILTQMLYYEGRGEDLQGQLAILRVVENRLDYETETYCDVVTEPNQFAYGEVPENTEQEIIVDLYLTEELQAPIWSEEKSFFYSGEKPYWAEGKSCITHGSHIFC